MAIYDLGTASLAANGEVTGVGTTWKAPLTLIRVGATIIFKTNPLKIYTISEIISDTQINVYNPNSETVPAGTGYAILAHDGITVQGLAQDVAETLRYYQSKETSIESLLQFIGQDNFDWPRFEKLANQSVTGAAESLASQIAAAESAATAISARDTTTAARDATITAINNAGDAGTLVTLAGYGLATDTTPLISNFDWQEFVFKSGGLYRVNVSSMKNAPNDIISTFGTSIAALCIQVISKSSNTTTHSLRVVGQSSTSNQYSREIYIQFVGAPGSRVYAPGREMVMVEAGKSGGGATASRARNLLDVYSKNETFQKSLNFSDVANKSAARANLDVYSASQMSGAGDSLGANLLGYKAQVANSVALTQQIKTGERISVFDFGAKADGSFDNANAFDLMVSAAESGVVVFFPTGVYKTSRPIRFTRPVQIYFDLGARIQLTTSGHDFIVEMDFRTEDQGYWAYKPFFGGERFILDGLGNSRRGLSLRGVISGNFPNLQVTNVTQTGLYLGWTQCCTYENYICSNNVEIFTTKPEYGVIVNRDDNALNPRGTSCDIWINPCIEHTSADGFYAPAMINSVILNGTIEGNGGSGLVLGHPTDPAYSALGNTIVGVDFEVNAAGDIVINQHSAMNDFIGLKSGYGSPSVQVKGFRNTFIGGAVSDFDFRPTSHDNHVQDVTLLAESPVVNDEGVKNTYERLWNFADAKPNVSTNPVNSRISLSGSTVQIDPFKGNYFVITATGTPITVTDTARKLDGARIDITIHNQSGVDSLVINWSDSFRMSGFTPPKAGHQKGVTLRYDSVYGHWYCTGEGFNSPSY